MNHYPIVQKQERQLQCGGEAPDSQVAPSSSTTYSLGEQQALILSVPQGLHPKVRLKTAPALS